MNYEKFVFIGAVIFAVLVLTNLIYLDYRLNNLPTSIITPSSTNLVLPKEVPASDSASLSSQGCDLVCQSVFQEYIDKQVSGAKSDILKIVNPTSNSVISIPAPTPTIQPLTLQPSNYYVYFVISGATQATDWADASGTQILFDTSSYPGAKAFYFQGNIRSDAPDKGAWARIFDVNHGVGVVGSDITFTGLESTLKESGPINLLPGNNVLRIQIHGLDGNFAYIDNAKIRISY